MRKYLFLLVSALFAVLLFGCKKDADLKAGKYEMESNLDAPAPYIELDEKGEYTFTYSFLSSRLNKGKYKIDDDTLILNTENTDNAYVFDIKEGNLVFNKDKSNEDIEVFSSEIPVLDESVFSYVD